MDARDLGVPLSRFLLGAVLYSLGSATINNNVQELAVVAVPHLWRLVPLAVGCAALLLVRRAPMVGLVIGLVPVAVDLLIGMSFPILIVLLELLYYAVLNASRRASYVLIGVLVAIVAGVTASNAVQTGDGAWTIQVFLSSAATLLGPAWWAMSVRQHREVADAERARAEHLARIAQLDRQAAVVGERTKMARDLHDVIAGHLSAIAIQSEAVLSMADGDPATVRTVLRSVRENSVQALTEMKTMIGLLRADGAAPESGRHTAPARLAELDRLVESARAGGLLIDAAVDLEGAGLPAAVELAAYRIVQEALTNAVKHAGGARTEVAVSLDRGRVVVEVTNDLTGDTSRVGPAGAGTGLISMQERAKAVGGTLSAGRHAAHWRVRAVLPAEGAMTSEHHSPDRR